MRLAMACDHGGFELKETLTKSLAFPETEIIDLGVHSTDSMDYPDKAHEIAETVLAGKADLGVLVCGTGIGVSIAVNRHPGIRAALCTDPFMARMSREHNNANILCLGGRVIGPSLAEDIVRAFLHGKFQGGRHARRIDKIEIK
ncbi:MAG: ribose 5-phosphate isomerase B [Deltaproteobacteria bacterium]|nr:ribose 5-phosphate isomerase B [Deltaproteobacteria bacterium]